MSDPVGATENTDTELAMLLAAARNPLEGLKATADAPDGTLEVRNGDPTTCVNAGGTAALAEPTHSHNHTATTGQNRAQTETLALCAGGNAAW
jgi:hypothetical protein